VTGERVPTQGLTRRTSVPRWVVVAAATAVATVATLAALAPPAVTPVLAADPVFGTPTIDSTFGEGLSLTQPVTLDETPARVEVLVTFSDASPLVTELPLPTSTGATTLRHQVSVAADGHLLPNTPVSARWRITPEDGDPVVGPEVDTVYADDRFDWKTVRGDLVTVHWYEGDPAFGERSLSVGEDAVEKTAELLGVTEDEPIDFFIYAELDAFYDALGPGTRENVGGQANAEIRTLFALVGPSDVGWDEIVVRHELVHLVFDTAVQNPYHFPPRWLNEGLAVYLSQGYEAGDRSAVESAARAGTLIPLDGLVGQFPTGDGFFLAYAESVSAVDFFIRTHDQDALVELIGSYADGLTDNEAFEAAIGMDVAEFNSAWLADLGAVVPQRHGPQPAPPGPRPSAWGAPGEIPGATTQPGAPAPIGSLDPGTGSGTGGGLLGSDATLALGLVALVVFGAVGLLVWSRSRRGRPGAVP
jgi:Peptidase MA superfamily